MKHCRSHGEFELKLYIVQRLEIDILRLLALPPGERRRRAGDASGERSGGDSMAPAGDCTLLGVPGARLGEAVGDGEYDALNLKKCVADFGDCSAMCVVCW